MKNARHWPSLTALDGETIWTESVARRLLDEWSTSGESLAAFGRRKGFVPQRLAWWKKRLAAVKPAASTREAPARPAFIPVTVCATASEPAEAVVVLDGGVRVELRSLDGASAAWVASLVRSLGSVS